MDLLRQEYDKSDSEDYDEKPAAGDSKSCQAVSETLEPKSHKCAACEMMLSPDQFSKNQLSKGDYGRCKSCVQKKSLSVKQQPKKKKTAFTVYAKSPFGAGYILEADPSGTISDIKWLIRDQSGIAPIQQVLLYQFKKLQSHRTIADYGLESGSTVHFLMGQEVTTRADRATYFVEADKLVTEIKNRRRVIKKGSKHFPFKGLKDTKTTSIVGEYDILYDGREHNFGLPLKGRKFFIEASANDASWLSNDRINGGIQACSILGGNYNRPYKFRTQFNRHLSETLDTDDDAETDLFHHSFREEAKCILIAAPGIEGTDNEATNFEAEDIQSDGDDTLFASVLVFNEQIAIPRNDLRIGGKMLSTAEGIRLMTQFKDAPSNSWICSHLDLPVEVAKTIFAFWRTEPPPCIMIETNDVLLSFVDSRRFFDDEELEEEGPAYVIARRRVGIPSSPP